MTTNTPQTAFTRHDEMFPFLGALRRLFGSGMDSRDEYPAMVGMFALVAPASDPHEAADTLHEIATTVHLHERRTLEQLHGERARWAYLDGLERRRRALADLSRLPFDRTACVEVGCIAERLAGMPRDFRWNGRAALRALVAAQDALAPAIETARAGAHPDAQLHDLPARYAEAAISLVCDAASALMSVGADEECAVAARGLAVMLNPGQYPDTPAGTVLLPPVLRAMTHLRTPDELRAEVRRWRTSGLGLLTECADAACRAMLLACATAEQFVPASNPDTPLLRSELESQARRVQNALAILAHSPSPH